MLVSRIAALVIVFALLIAFLIASAVGASLDPTVVIAFLGIASGLLFGPAGWYLAKRNNSSSEE